MRVQFSEVFQANPDGSCSPKCRVRIGGVSMGPGIAFGRGVSFAGVDIANCVGRDLEIDQEGDGAVVIKGVY